MRNLSPICLIGEPLHKNLHSAAQSRSMDRMLIDEYGYSGLALMTMAGEKAFNVISRWPQASENQPWIVICGSGNNGGDGYVVANCALNNGLRVAAVSAAPPKTEDAVSAFRSYVDNGGIVEDDADVLARAGLIIDGLLGTGLDRAPSGKYSEIIDSANKADCPVFALDVPSGLDGDSGAAFDPCIAATATITFIARKIGLYVSRGRELSGEIFYESLNLPDGLTARFRPVCRLIEYPVKLERLKQRPPDSHKGNYGRVAIVGGDRGMLGAVLMAGRAALECGSGLVTIISTEDHLDLAAIRYPELMSQCFENPSRSAQVLEQCDVVVLGPGLGRSRWSEKSFNAAVETGKNMLVDADGLFYLARSGLERDNWILTPHPGEAAALLGCATEDIRRDRCGAAVEISKKHGGVCVLKGSGTLIAKQNETVTLCNLGNPGMATAGMGDVLSGMIGSLVGQGFSLTDAAETGVWLHAKCADGIAGVKGEASLIATDVIDSISVELNALGRSSEFRDRR